MIGIGISDPMHKLDVAGDINFSDSKAYVGRHLS